VNQELQAQLLELEREFWRASGDRAFYERHFAPDGIAVLPMQNGIMDANTVIDNATTGIAWKSLDFTNVQSREIASGVVSLAYEARAQRANGPEYHALLSSVYRRNGDAWQMVLHQQTPLPG
jgi:hypothetical protein